MIFKSDKVYEIMRQIDNIKGQNQHFVLLGQMDFFVKYNLLIVFQGIGFDQNEREQRHAQSREEGNGYYRVFHSVSIFLLPE